MRIHLLHKRDQPGIDRTVALFHQRNAEVEKLASDSPDHIKEILDRPGIDRLVVSGGDGMIHHAAQMIAGSGVPLGIVPAGTGNDIARALGIPTSTAAAVELAVGDPVAMDLLRIASQEHESYVVSVLTTGFSGTVNEVANSIRRVGGQLKYTLATMRCLPRLHDAGLDGLAGHPRVCLLAIGNTPYFGGGMKICPAAVPDDGEAELIVVDPVNPLHLAAVLPSAFIGQHVRSRKVHSQKLSRIELETDTVWWADGEPLPHRGPVTIDVVPGALPVTARL